MILGGRLHFSCQQPVGCSWHLSRPLSPGPPPLSLSVSPLLFSSPHHSTPPSSIFFPSWHLLSTRRLCIMHSFEPMSKRTPHLKIHPFPNVPWSERELSSSKEVERIGKLLCVFSFCVIVPKFNLISRITLMNSCLNKLGKLYFDGMGEVESAETIMSFLFIDCWKRQNSFNSWRIYPI